MHVVPEVPHRVEESRRSSVVARSGRGWSPRRLVSHRWTLLATLVVLNGVDLVLTRILLARGAAEANPVMAPLIDSWWGWAVKTLGVGLVALAVLVTGRDGKVERWLQVVVGVYTAVVAWNLVVLLASL
ncbi:MAG: DUF5658 family protein [Acidimicrobiales bacterium]|nr:DUF5658 family protein [Acidimicrobiales bacterium]